ncbi:MAG: class I SAM-dependent methyltransferase [Rhodocyclales bacterium]|nr:class I SAM-dependent methyltransferase [Rhodocyclales bacterium]
MNQEVMWSKRYRDAGEHYLFGTEPNRFLAHRAERLQDGKTALSVADGEGRNSVWLAEQGLDVTAVEISSIAVEKARRLAAGRDAAVDFVLADMLAADWPPADLHEGFDWVVGIFIQFVGPEDRKRQFAAMKQLTRPGGRILLQGYTPKQLDYRTGGPSAVENLFLQLARCHQRQDLVDGEQVTEHFLAQCFLCGGRKGSQLTVIFGQCLAGQKRCQKYKNDGLHL